MTQENQNYSPSADWEERLRANQARADRLSTALSMSRSELIEPLVSAAVEALEKEQPC